MKHGKFNQTARQLLKQLNGKPCLSHLVMCKIKKIRKNQIH